MLPVGRARTSDPSIMQSHALPTELQRNLLLIGFVRFSWWKIQLRGWILRLKPSQGTRISNQHPLSWKNSLIWCHLQIIQHRYLRLVVGSCVTTGFRRLLHVRTNPFLSREPSECRRMRAWLDIVWNFSSTEMKGKNGQTTKIQMASAVLFFSVFRHHSWNLFRLI